MSLSAVTPFVTKEKVNIHVCYPKRVLAWRGFENVIWIHSGHDDFS